jgi:hypothetical protein
MRFLIGLILVAGAGSPLLQQGSAHGIEDPNIRPPATRTIDDPNIAPNPLVARFRPGAIARH